MSEYMYDDLVKKGAKIYSNVPKKHSKEKSLTKAKGGLIGKLKKTIKDKGLKRDHYADFKKQYKMK